MSAPLRIAIVTETYPPEVNGVASTVGHMVRGLRERGHAVQLIRPRQAGELQPDQSDELLVRGLAIPRYQELRLGLPAKRRLLRLWREQRPDIVHIVTEGPLGASGLRAARRLGLPVSSGFHTNFAAYSRHYGVGLMTRVVAGYLRSLHNRTDCTLVPTREMQQRLEGAGYRHVEVLGRGIDTGLFDPARRSEALRASWGAAPGDTVVLHVGRLAREKNLDLFAEAAQAMRSINPRVVVVIVGDGPEGEFLRRRHPDFHFAGMQTGEALATHYASADIFLFPSLTETFGNVTIEAMASGLAVCAWDYAAAASHIDHNISGLLVPRADPRAFIAQASALAGVSARIAALGQAARQAALELGWSHIHQRLEQILLEAIRRHQINMSGHRPA
jgi:glycosyltransferase involved in cell wall biosynthesis